MAKYKYKTEEYIKEIAKRDMPIADKIDIMVEYIQYVSRWSYQNRYYATKFFMQWLLMQNVRDIHVAEAL